MKQEYKKLVAKVIKSNPIKPAGKARKITRSIGQESQRFRTTKTGAKTKKPSAVSQWFNQEAENVLNDIASGRLTTEKTASKIALRSRYLRGFLMGARIANAISEKDRLDTVAALMKAISGVLHK